MNFSPNSFRLNLTFPLPPKRRLSILLNFFFPLTNLFLTCVVFACFATTRVNMRFRAKNTWGSAQVYIQCMKCIGNPVARTDGWTYVRTDGRSRDYYVTTKISWLDRLPNFLSNGAPHSIPARDRISLPQIDHLNIIITERIVVFLLFTPQFNCKRQKNNTGKNHFKCQ